MKTRAKAGFSGKEKKTAVQFPAGEPKDIAGPSRQAECDVLQPLRQLYLALPVLPLADRSTSAILYASVAAYLAFTAYLFLSIPKIEPQLSLYEFAISKNALLQLQPGESYSYRVFSPEGDFTVYYDIRDSPSCTGVVVVERLPSETTSRCVLPSGNLAQDGYGNVNWGMGNQSILLFSPWMLAASENFTWEVTAEISAGGAVIEMPARFNSLGKKEIAGREAFEVLVGASGEAPAKFTVDAQKRVTLSFDSKDNFRARLMQAPFPLAWGNSS